MESLTQVPVSDGKATSISGGGEQSGPRRQFLRFRANAWFGFVARRFVSLVIILFGLVVAVFLMVRLIPGDPARVVAGSDATQAQVEEVRHGLGLNKPLPQQFGAYLGNLAHGNLGNSFQFRAPVSKLLSANAPYSLSLAGAALFLVLVIAIPGGMLVAAYTRNGRHRHGESVYTTVTSVAGSLPEFLTGTFLALIFAVWLKAFPIAGSKGWKSMVLPAFALAIRPIAVNARVVRVETLNAMQQDYMRTARSKQLPERILYRRHALPNVLTATLTLGGVLFTSLIAGAIVIENIFGRRGVGTLLVNAVQGRDYPVIQGIMLFLGVTVVFVNAIIDLALAAVDPRSLAKEGRDA